jgi:hypothetical protein
MSFPLPKARTAVRLSWCQTCNCFRVPYLTYTA